MTIIYQNVYKRTSQFTDLHGSEDTSKVVGWSGGWDSRLRSLWMVFPPGMNPLDNPCNVGFQVIGAFAFEFHHNFGFIGVPGLLSDDFHDLRLVVFGDLLEGVFPTSTMNGA